MRRSSNESKERQNAKKGKASASRIDYGPHQPPTKEPARVNQPPPQAQPKATPPAQSSSNFRFVISRPQAIVIDLMGVVICKSFMTSSKEFRDFFQHNVLEYLNDNWKQRQLKIMMNFFRCSQGNIPEDYKLAEREESKEEQVKQARRHVIWRLRNDPTNSALSLFMLGITEWGYRNKTLLTSIYDDVPAVLKQWKEHSKIPIYVGVGSADFLIMVLSNTNYGNILPYFNGHMNIMDFDGTRANKDYKKLAHLLHLPPNKILYLTRFRQDCKKAIENGMQSLLVLRQDFDSHGLISRLKARRGPVTSMDGTKLLKGPANDEVVSPPNKNQNPDMDNPDLREQYKQNLNSLSLIDDHDENERYNNQSSQIVEQDLSRYSIVLSLSEIAFK